MLNHTYSLGLHLGTKAPVVTPNSAGIFSSHTHTNIVSALCTHYACMHAYAKHNLFLICSVSSQFPAGATGLDMQLIAEAAPSAVTACERLGQVLHRCHRATVKSSSLHWPPCNLITRSILALNWNSPGHAKRVSCIDTSEFRSHDLQSHNLTRCQLRHCICSFAACPELNLVNGSDAKFGFSATCITKVTQNHLLYHTRTC